jgi:hypothetical protein
MGRIERNETPSKRGAQRGGGQRRAKGIAGKQLTAGVDDRLSHQVCPDIVALRVAARKWWFDDSLLTHFIAIQEPAGFGSPPSRGVSSQAMHKGNSAQLTVDSL